MWDRFMSRLRGTWLAAKFRTDPLKAMVAVCVACVAGALVLGACSPWPLLQNAAADFVGGTFAGLVIFALANIAFGFTERRDRERHALEIAYKLLLWELIDNLSELHRIVRVLQAGALTRGDPLFIGYGRLKVENWQLLIQSPLIANLPTDLVWRMHNSYFMSRRAQEQLRESSAGVWVRKPQAWKGLCQENLPMFQEALEQVSLAMEELTAAQEQPEPGNARRD